MANTTIKLKALKMRSFKNKTCYTTIFIRGFAK